MGRQGGRSGGRVSGGRLGEAIERGRMVGFHDFVAKFDRTGLIAAIKEQSADLNRAA